jgi:hypothetical protein
VNTAYAVIGNFGSLDWNVSIYDALSGVSKLAVSVRDKANVLSLAYSMHKVNKKLAEFFKRSDGLMDGSIKPDANLKPVTKEDVLAMGYTLNKIHQTISQNIEAMTQVGLQNNSLTASSLSRLNHYNERVLDLADWVEAVQLSEFTNEVFNRAHLEVERGELFDLAQVQ